MTIQVKDEDLLFIAIQMLIRANQIEKNVKINKYETICGGLEDIEQCRKISAFFAYNGRIALENYKKSKK